MNSVRRVGKLTDTHKKQLELSAVRPLTVSPLRGVPFAQGRRSPKGHVL